MTVTALSTHRVEKPWGRHKLGAGFADVAPDAPAIGEIWFSDPSGADHELMVKYLFTSERLSIQVHPGDVDAQAAGYLRGKEEAWIILAAEAEAVIGLGTKRAVPEAVLRDAVLDGSIEQIIDWKPVKPGDIIYLPAGTIHAIGAGISLIEVQQNVDLTYRLYDYGRPRELHLDAGLAVARPEPFEIDGRIIPLGGDCLSLVQGGKFVIEQWNWSGTRRLNLLDGLEGWFIPVTGDGLIDGKPWHAQQCWHVAGDVEIEIGEGADILFAYPGATPQRIFAGR